jgi:hypothetical protein
MRFYSSAFILKHHFNGYFSKRRNLYASPEFEIQVFLFEILP